MNFDIEDAKLKEVIRDSNGFLEYIYAEKWKYTQTAIDNGCRKMAQFQAIECLKYKIQQNR